MFGRLSELASIEDSRGSMQRSDNKARIVGANVRRLPAAEYGRRNEFMAIGFWRCFEEGIMNGF